MKIIHDRTTFAPANNKSLEDRPYQNCLVLYDDNWNDYGYRTTFYLVYYGNNKDFHPIGDIKIYYYDIDYNRTSDYYCRVSDKIDNAVYQLDEKFCSLGQSLTFYKNLKTYCPNDYLDILDRLNDMVKNKDIRKKFEGEHGVQTSLLRSVSAVKALNDGYKFLNLNETVENNISFSYKAKIPYLENRVEFNFNFKKKSYKDIPYRINVLVGKNGVGKTQLLTVLADNLSGLSNDQSEINLSFPQGRPNIDKVISISFSAFDEFRQRDLSNVFLSKGYDYCGIKKENGVLSEAELEEIYNRSYEMITSKKRLNGWRKILGILLEDEHSDLLKNIEKNGLLSQHMSSGQLILICSMTEVIANIERESLLLFDEPELHLHPNAISNLLRTLNKMLEEFDSYAILATHSPLIIQEICKEQIQILNRIDDVLTVVHPDFECFGNNLTEITNSVFDVTSRESNYKSVLSKLSKTMSFEQVMAAFGNDLSLNAMIFLKQCYKGDDSL